MLKIIYKLFKIKLLTPAGLFRLLNSIYISGTNLMTLLYFAARTFPEKTALIDEKEKLNYRQLLKQVKRLTVFLKKEYQLKRGIKAGFFCQNHAMLVKYLFAVSRLGPDIYLLNTEMSLEQFNRLAKKFSFDLIICDKKFDSFLEESVYNNKKITINSECISTPDNKNSGPEDKKIKRSSAGNITVLTGGTTGEFKTAAHKPSLFTFLNPFFALLTRANLDTYNSVYIATPVYHGFGLSAIIIATVLGKSIYITQGFNAKKACQIIDKYRIEVTTIVPLMLYKMLEHDYQSLKSLKCILSGGAALSPVLVNDTFNKLGNVLFNLYGSSEAGFSIMATPADLKYSAKTIGKKIKGVKLKILNKKGQVLKNNQIGQFCIKSSWSIKNKGQKWISTGDLGFKDSKNYYFLAGRSDDMIVSAGENVYPIEVEQILLKHPDIIDTAVIGIKDEIFGERLKAFVSLKKESHLSAEVILKWLKSRVARYQVPKEIVIVEKIPYTSLGKVDKKSLK